MPTILRSTRSGPKRRRSRGQVVVIFAGAAILFMLLCAAVVDISWYWTNNLRIQRAADAAALAGVVYLPGTPPYTSSSPFYIAAAAEATKNGYTNGSNGFTVTPEVDPNDNRRIHVTIKGPVGTFFARVVGINSWPASRDARADFVLPVPMGSPQNYYGVSKLFGTTPVSTPTNTPSDTDSGLDTATTSPAGTPWVASSGTLALAVKTADALFVSTKTNAATQQFGGFGLDSQLAANQSVTTVTGLQVSLINASVSATCANTRIGVALSWNAGTSWTTVTAQTAKLTTTPASSTFGLTTDTTFWTTHTTWLPSEIQDPKFRVRLTGIKGCSGGANTNIQLKADQITVRADYTINTTGSAITGSADDTTARPVPDPSAPATALTPQGFWGAIITSGGDRGNGDRYSPTENTNRLGTVANDEYDGKGYDYTVEVGVGGQVKIYDATFCATGTNTLPGQGGSYGVGDHWIGAVGPVTTIFNLFNTKGTPYNLGDDGPAVATSGILFAGEQQRDYSHNYGEPGGSDADCSSSAYHNKWWTLANGLAPGTYRLNVSTAAAANLTTNAENMWAVWVSGGTAPRVYGGGRMVAYTNLPSGTPTFYLAQIPKEHAGKTMFIDLFDPGDVGGNAFIRIKTPDGNAYNDATFSYTATDDSNPSNSTSGNNVKVIQVASGGTNLFNNEILTISIDLPATYGKVGLTPPGESEAGWWKIEYQVAGGNDTTTWKVSIRGNPVHLVLP